MSKRYLPNLRRLGLLVRYDGMVTLGSIGQARIRRHDLTSPKEYPVGLVLNGPSVFEIR